MSSDRRRSGQIDSIRAIAIFWVLFDHLYLVEGAGPLGRIGVRLFLVLSGFLITRTLLASGDRIRSGASSTRHEIAGFYARRAIRIFPAYYLTIVLTYLLLDIPVDGYITWHATFQSSVLFAIVNDWGPPWQLSHLWTLSVQEQFYLVWPILIFICPRRFLLPVIVVAIAAEPIFRLAMAARGLGDSVANSTLIPASMGALGIGALAAFVERTRYHAAAVSRRSAIAATTVAILLLLDPAGILPLSSVIPDWTLELIWLAPLAVLVLTASIGLPGPVGRVLDWGPLQFLGRVSLGLYLYHLLAGETVAAAAEWLGRPIVGPGPVLFIAGLALTVVFATMSWFAIERPAQALKRLPMALSGRRPTAAEPVEWGSQPAYGPRDRDIR